MGPSLADVIDVLRYAVLPAVAAAAAAFFVGARVFGQVGAKLAGAAAVIIGILAANYYREALEFRLGGDVPLSFQALGKAVYAGVTNAKSVAPRQWLPFVVLLGLVVGLVTEKWGRVGRLLVIVVALLSGWLLTASITGAARFAWAAGFATIAALNWHCLAPAVESQSPGIFASGGALLFLAAAAVTIHAHSGRMTDVALMTAGSLFGIGVIAWWIGARVRGIITVIALGLPGIMFVVKEDSFSEVPLLSFVLIATAPMASLLVRVSYLARLPSVGRGLIFLIALLLPCAAAVVFAMRVESLGF